MEATQFCRTCGTRRERYVNDRRMCTVLFADVHGYTAMSETLNDVEKVTNIMNDVFARLTEKIVDLGGSIDKYAGDNIMARFGAPEAHEDDPERAVRAAMEMQAELRKISAELQAQYGFGLDMRIGLNTGEVNAAEVGGEVRGISYKTYTIMGDTVNLASRLEHEARIGHVLVGELTYKLSSHAFEFIDIGYKQIRGKREPVHCYEVVGPKQERKNRRGLAGRDLPLIGRDNEMAVLWEKLQKVLEGRGQVVSVVGEAGVGKSSLLREFNRRIKAYDPDVWYLDGTAFSYSSGQYFSLMRTMLFKYCKISETEEPAEMRKKLLAAIRELLGETNEPDATEFGEYAALLGQIAGLSLPNTFIDGLDPQKRNNLLIETMSEFLLKKGESTPLVLVLDDLHWADNNSLKVLDRIVAKVTHAASTTAHNLRNLEVLLLLLYRPDFTRAWPVAAQAGDSYDYIKLDRLSPQQMEPLVRQFLEEWLKVQEPERQREATYGPIPATLMQLVERAGGNAFFAEEILKRLLEDGHLLPDENEESGWQLVGNLEDFKPPETLQEILLARVDRLAVYDKRVLQIASVVGNRFEKRILLAVDELSQAGETVNSSITTLQRRDLIALERREPEAEYVFRHYLTREVAYNNLLGVERSHYHGEVAQALERFKSDRLNDYTVIDDLAYHYERSTNEEKAAQYLILAGNMRQSLFRNDEALKAFYEAQEILQGPDFRDHPDTNNRLVEIYSNIGDILALKEEYGQAIEHYDSALERCGEPVSRIGLQAKLMEVQGKTGAYDKAMQAYESARQEFNRLSAEMLETDGKTQHLRAKLLYLVGWIYQSQGHYDEALDSYQTSLKLLEVAGTDNRELQIDRGRAYNGLGQVYVDKGDIAESEECLHKAAQLHQQTSKLDALARTYNELGYISVLKGDLVKADYYLTLSRDNARRAGDVETAAASLGGLGFIATRQGRLEMALRHFHSLENSPNPVHIANAQLNIGQVLLQKGLFGEALLQLDKSIKLAESIGYRALVAEGYNSLGWLYMASRNFTEADIYLNEGLSRSLELNNPQLTGQARLLRLDLYLEQNDVARAEIEEEAAEKLVTEVGDPLMVGQLERLKGKLAFLKGDYAAATAAFEQSLNNFEPVKAFLEMSYTKLYYARALLAAHLRAPETETLDRARGLLMQSVSTFEACDALFKKDEAEALLRELGEPVTA
ncbi:MAG TPA: tetratricopeptide repeat protein [Chloroflexia bacterium]|nr:tetratricopeptide repeat protein [Chloroflexia bacterium]